DCGWRALGCSRRELAAVLSAFAGNALHRRNPPDIPPTVRVQRRGFDHRGKGDDNSMRPNGWVVGTAFIAALVASLPIDAAAKPKQTVNAIINGHKLNLKNRQINPGSAVVGAGGIAITAGTKFHHLGQTAKTLVVTCAAGPLAGFLGRARSARSPTRR